MQVPEDKDYFERNEDFFGYTEAGRDELEGIKEAHSQSGDVKKSVHDLVARLLEQKRGGRILDIGSSIGLNADNLKRRGFDTYCVELSHTIVEFLSGRGHKAFFGPVGEAGFDEGFFDAVTMLEVLEHVRDPLAELREVFRILKPGGIFVCEVPNLYFQLVKGKIEKTSPYRVLVGKPVYGLMPDIHLNYFSRRTLGAMLRKAGFTSPEFHVKPRTLDRPITSEKYPRYMNALLGCYAGFSAFALRHFSVLISNAMIAVCSKP